MENQISKKKKCSVPISFISIDETGYHLLVEVTINRKKCRLVLDTGASRTVFDKDEIKRFVKEGSNVIEGKLSAGLGTDQMETHSVHLKNFRIGRLSLTNYEAVALDLAVLNSSYAQMGHGKVAGVLGSDVLFAYDAVIDFGKKKMLLSVRT